MNSSRTMSTTTQTNKHSSLGEVWKNRSNLEKILIVALIVFIVILLGVIIFIIVQNAIPLPVCITPGCLIAASQIVAHIDPTVNPCDDFFKFACGKFVRRTHGDIKAATVKTMEKQVERQLAEIIKKPIQDDDNYWIKHQKVLLQACMNESVVGNDTLNAIETILDDINGWPVVDRNMWDDRLFDWKEVIFKLKAKGFVNDMLLEIAVVEDRYNNSNKHIILVLLPHVQKIEKERRDLYKRYMTNVAVEFGADRHWAAIEMEKVLSLMEDLRRISDDKASQLNTTTFNRTAEVLKTRYTVEKYQEQNGDVNWLEFINRFLEPVAKITKDEVVVFPKLDYTKAFFKLINKLSKRTLANYIVWKVLESVIQLMPERLAKVREEYTCLMKRTPKETDRFKFCQNEIKNSYSHHVQPADIMYARKYLPKAQKDQIQEMVDNIKHEFTELVQKNTWMDEVTKTKALEKISNIKEIIGAPGDYFDDSVLRQILGDEEPETKNQTFIEMLLKQHRLTQKLGHFKLHLNANDRALEPFYRFTTTVNAMYSFYDNAIIIPAGILQDIFYASDRPMYLNYGAIGSIVGHEITHGLGEFGSFYDHEGRKNSIWTNETLEAYKERVKCVVEEAEDFGADDFDKQINGTLTLEENVADYTGLKVSYGAYKKWTRRHAAEKLLPQINYTPLQLFWISAVLYECFQFDKYSGQLEDIYHAHNSFRVVAPLRNNPDFVNDFGCPVGTKMNAKEKCQIF